MSKHTPPLRGTLPSGLVYWLSGGQRGQSSNTMVEHLVGLPACAESRKSHPYDPDDFDRCLKLLAAVPLLRVCLPQMATCSPEWAALVAHWGEIEQSHLDEVGLGWTKARSAPKTYALMQKVFQSGKATTKDAEVSNG